MKKYMPLPLLEPALHVAGQYTFVGIYLEFQNDCDAMCRREDRTESSPEHYSNIIRNTIYPHLPGHNFKPIGDYTTQDFENAIQSIIKDSKKKAVSEGVKYDKATIQTVRCLICSVVTVAFENQKTLYNIYAPDFTEEKKTQLLEEYGLHNIQPKSFSVEQEYAIATYLSQTCLESGESVGLLLMFALGLRCAETAAASFDDLIEIKDYPDFYCLVIHHTNKNIMQASRIVPVSKNIYSMLKQIEVIRKNALLLSGKKQSEIPNLPIACKGKNYLERCDISSLYHAGREMLTQIGIRKEYLAAISMMIDEENAAAKESATEEEFADIEQDPISYIFRRNAATHWHTLHMNDDAIAYLMGHQMDCLRIQDYGSIDQLSQLDQKLKLRPILNHIHYNDDKYLPIYRIAPSAAYDFTDVNDIVIDIPPHSDCSIPAIPNVPGDDVNIQILSDNSDYSMKIHNCAYVRNTPMRTRNSNMIKLYHKMYYDVIQDYVISLPQN